MEKRTLPEGDWATSSEYCEKYGITRQALQLRREKGQVKYKKIGSIYLYDISYISDMDPRGGFNNYKKKPTN